MDFNALRDFVIVATQGGFGAAARADDTPKTTLSRRIRQLEDELGYRLIERSKSAFHLTEEGQALVERAAPLIRELDGLVEEVVGHPPRLRGRLRIGAPAILAHTILGGVAARFHAHHPEVDLQIVAEDRPGDPLGESYDAILRASAPERDGLAGRRVMSERLLLVASPEVGGDPLPFVALGDGADVQEVEIITSNGLHAIPVEVVLRFSSQIMTRSAVLAGAGAALLPSFLVGTDLAEGKLSLLGEFHAPPIDVWLLYPNYRQPNPRLRAFAAFIEAEFPQRSMIPGLSGLSLAG